MSRDRQKGARAVFFALLLIAVAAAYLRLHNLVPPDRGLQFLQDYDEAVWDTTAQLMLQGFLPYRDFFATLPPVGIYLLAGVLRLVNVTWGSAVGLMATRYASVIYGLATVAVTYLVGCRLASRRVGLLAAGLLALDGMVVGMDRRAMLEPPLNLFSAMAVLSYLSVFEGASGDRRGRHVAVLTGLLSAVAALSKTPGFVVVVALITVSLLRRRLWEMAIIAVSFAIGWALLSIPFLLQCPDDFIKQVYFFQFLRPADGVVHRVVRLYDMWHYPSAWLTVRTGLVGGLLLVWLIVWRGEARRWLVVLAWATYTMLLIMANGSYWPQYYVQLAVPLSLLGGGLLEARLRFLWPRRGTAGRYGLMTVGVLALVMILGVGGAAGRIAHQLTDTARMLEQVSPVYADVAAYLRQNTDPKDAVLVFEPNYTFLSSRPLAGASPGTWFVDSYGEMLYGNLGIQERPLLALVGDVFAGTEGDLQETFWRAPAQDQVLAAFDRAEYVVVDGRARYQLAPQTLATIKARSTEEWAAGPASVRRRR